DAETADVSDAPADAGTAIVPAAQAEPAVETETAAAPADKATLHVARPSQNELTLTVNGQSITLNPEQLGQLIEE
ncbi:phage tail protein, partial [Escherichia coli]